MWRVLAAVTVLTVTSLVATAYTADNHNHSGKKHPTTTTHPTTAPSNYDKSGHGAHAGHGGGHGH